MKTWVSFRIERTKIGIINYNKKTTAKRQPLSYINLLHVRERIRNPLL